MSGDSGSITSDYRYDYRNRRIAKSVFGETPAQKTFFYDGWRLLNESTPSGGYSNYIWIGDRPVARIDTTGPDTTDAEMYLLATNQVGAPRMALDTKTGAVVWAADYEPFGLAHVYVPGARSEPSIEINLRFPGQYYDGESGLHYNWHRYYDPLTGRYTTPDPLGLDGGDFGLFNYAGGDPVNMVDPMGLVILTVDSASEAAVAQIAATASLQYFIEQMENDTRAYIVGYDPVLAGSTGGRTYCSGDCAIAWNTAAAIAARYFSGGFTDAQVVAHELGHAYDYGFTGVPYTLESMSMVFENAMRTPGPYRKDGVCE